MKYIILLNIFLASIFFINKYNLYFKINKNFKKYYKSISDLLRKNYSLDEKRLILNKITIYGLKLILYLIIFLTPNLLILFICKIININFLISLLVAFPIFFCKL